MLRRVTTSAIGLSTQRHCVVTESEDGVLLRVGSHLLRCVLERLGVVVAAGIGISLGLVAGLRRSHAASALLERVGVVPALRVVVAQVVRVVLHGALLCVWSAGRGAGVRRTST